jgi:hypothetical protein
VITKIYSGIFIAEKFSCGMRMNPGVLLGLLTFSALVPVTYVLLRRQNILYLLHTIMYSTDVMLHRGKNYVSLYFISN